MGKTSLTFISSKQVWIILTVLFVAVILLWSILSGASSGKNLAQAELVLNNAKNITTGLNFFYNDQERFPSAAEFSDPKIMSSYFNFFPPATVVSSNCAENFVYKRSTLVLYELNFCLAKGLNGYQAGWNTINVEK